EDQSIVAGFATIHGQDYAAPPPRIPDNRLPLRNQHSNIVSRPTARLKISCQPGVLKIRLCSESDCEALSGRDLNGLLKETVLLPLSIVEFLSPDATDGDANQERRQPAATRGA